LSIAVMRLHQVGDRHAAVLVAARDRDHQPQVRLHEVVLARLVVGVAAGGAIHAVAQRLLALARLFEQLTQHLARVLRARALRPPHLGVELDQPAELGVHHLGLDAQLVQQLPHVGELAVELLQEPGALGAGAARLAQLCERLLPLLPDRANGRHVGAGAHLDVGAVDALGRAGQQQRLEGALAVEILLQRVGQPQDDGRRTVDDAVEAGAGDGDEARERALLLAGEQRNVADLREVEADRVAPAPLGRGDRILVGGQLRFGGVGAALTAADLGDGAGIGLGGLRLGGRFDLLGGFDLRFPLCLGAVRLGLGRPLDALAAPHGQGAGVEGRGGGGLLCGEAARARTPGVLGNQPANEGVTVRGNGVHVCPYM
jgi:hypothetical protein